MKKICLVLLILTILPFYVRAATDTVHLPLYLTTEVDSLRFIHFQITDSTQDSTSTFVVTGSTYRDTSVTVNTAYWHGWEAVYWFSGATQPIDEWYFYSKARNIPYDSLWFRPRVRTTELLDSLIRYVITSTDSTRDTTASSVYSLIDSLKITSRDIVTIRYLLYYVGETDPIPYDIVFQMTGTDKLGTPSTEYYCRVWGTVVVGGDSLGSAHITVAYPPDKNNSCDSTILVLRSAETFSERSGGAHHKGYFQLDLPYSSCFGDKKFKMTIEHELIKTQSIDIIVPDSATYRVYW